MGDAARQRDGWTSVYGATTREDAEELAAAQTRWLAHAPGRAIRVRQGEPGEAAWVVEVMG